MVHYRQLTKPVKYTVGLPSGASVFLEKMNVVYIGVDNPMTISGGSVGREKVHVSFTSPGASLTNTGGDHYVAKANYTRYVENYTLMLMERILNSRSVLKICLFLLVSSEPKKVVRFLLPNSKQSVV